MLAVCDFFQSSIHKQRHPNADINLFYCRVCFSTFINPNGLKKHIKTNVRMSFRFWTSHFKVVDFLFFVGNMQITNGIERKYKREESGFSSGRRTRARLGWRKENSGWEHEKVFDTPYNEVCPPLFLMNYCSIYSIQSIGKVSKLPTYSKKRGNGANKIKKKVCRVKNSLTFIRVVPKMSSASSKKRRRSTLEKAIQRGSKDKNIDGIIYGQKFGTFKQNTILRKVKCLRQCISVLVKKIFF